MSTFDFCTLLCVIAEHSKANNRNLWVSISTNVYISPRSVSHASPAPGGKARVQNGASGTCNYVDAVFELLAHNGLENWASLSCSFTKGRLTVQLLG